MIFLCVFFMNYEFFKYYLQHMSGRVVSDIQTRAEGESLYIRYNTAAHVVNSLKNDSSVMSSLAK